MAYPTIPFLEQVGEPLRRMLSKFVVGLSEFVKKEHKDDGSHGAITADSITERGRTTPQGEWIDVPYNAANFTGNGTMTWTVDAADVSNFRYMLIGKTLFVDGIFNTTSVTAPLNTMLKVKIPGGYIAAKPNRATNQATDSGVITTSQVRVDAGNTTIDIQRQDAANWTAAVNTTAVRVHTWFEVQ